ncbi:Rv3654c family TadE-like protein [uncultured Pseudokineococcus sp.]|uniref:Rv3654c family TadE-like protein n=1 Tax=uncultured Pseudokineococcus sp. TaxID=1642928 RepID=UPI002634AF98|nr:Rv3654c family TadE-like protein [uncultured Pseudokineococcus sp.]
MTARPVGVLGRREDGRREDGRREDGRREDGRREDGRREGGRRELGRLRGDCGAGTVLVVAVVLAGLLVCSAGAALGQAVVARHRASAAADLAALAAADVLVGRSAGDACGAAVRVAGRGGARLLGCRPVGQEVVVEVAVDVAGVLGGLGPARAAARAGPAPT